MIRMDERWPSEERKVVLSIAMSLDGFVADARGGVGWLCGHGETDEIDPYFSAFYDRVDTILMGRVSYEQITRELSPHAWAYEGKACYVATTKPLPPDENVTLIRGNLTPFLHDLRQQRGDVIWVLGGAILARECLEADLLDEVILSLVPIVLGSGIPLFGGELTRKRFRLLETSVHDGVVTLRYGRF